MSTVPTRRAMVQIFTSGDSVVITNPGPAVCKVYKMILSFGGSANLIVKDGSTQIDGPYFFTAKGSSFTLYNDGDPHWITQGNFVLNIDQVISLTGQVYYTLG